MANLAAIRSVGSSLAEFLNRTFQAAAFPADVNKPNATFSVVSSGGIQEQEDPSNLGTSVLIFLYRVSVDPHLRNSGRLSAPDMAPPPLSVALHYLFTFWSNSAENEHLLAGWTMRQLQSLPLLDATILSPEARWSAEEVVQVIPEELSNEDLMRIWDALTPGYRLSLGYVARVVRIDPEEAAAPAYAPVVATRFHYAVPADASP